MFLLIVYNLSLNCSEISITSMSLFVIVFGKMMIAVISFLLLRFELMRILGIIGRNVDMFWLRRLRNGRSKFLRDWTIFMHMIPVLFIGITIANYLVGRADNELNQLENSSRLDSIIDSLNLVHEPNKSNLSWKLSSLNKWVELELSMVRLVWFMNQFDIYKILFCKLLYNK